jgi:hypothetical protein
MTLFEWVTIMVEPRISMTMSGRTALGSLFMALSRSTNKARGWRIARFSTDEQCECNASGQVGMMMHGLLKKGRNFWTAT